MWTKTRRTQHGYGIVIDIYQNQTDPKIAKAFSLNDGETWRICGYFPPTSQKFTNSRSAILAAIVLCRKHQPDPLKIF
jgi:hypothetical protein